MKNPLWLAAAVLASATYPVAAQQAGADASVQAHASAGPASASTSANSNANTASGQEIAANSSSSAGASAQMLPVRGELVKKVDAKTAKAGDPVVLRTTEKMRTADGVEIPKGSRLVGHITEVQAPAKGQAQSHMDIVFDRAELKSGKSMAIRSCVQTIEPPVILLVATTIETSDEFDAPAASMPSAGLPAGRRGGDSGLLGGANGVVAHTTSSLETPSGSFLASTSHIASSATGHAAGTLHTDAGSGAASAGGDGLTAQATGIPGVLLQSQASGAATLVASGKNLHLDSGTQMVVALAAAH